MNDQTITATSGDDDSKASLDARPMSDDVSGTTAHPVIEDVAPRRIHDFGDLVHAVSAVLLAAALGTYVAVTMPHPRLTPIFDNADS